MPPDSYAQRKTMAKVALVKCMTYESVEVEAAMKKAVDLLGGAGAYAKRGERILFKPNIMQGRPPDLCVTTHPAIFEAVAKVFKPTHARLCYGDGPAVGGSLEHLEKAGIRSVAEKLGIEPADFDNGAQITHPAGTILKNFIIARGVLDCDALISLPKFKTHDLLCITGAVKNQFGCIPGLIKAHYHACLPDAYKFSRFIADVTAFVRPRLFIMDAVFAMEGNGPQSGDPKNLGCILASTDPVALDAVACKLINLNPRYVPTCPAGAEAGLGTFAFDDITILGDDYEKMVDTTFKVVRKPSRHFSKFTSKLFARKFFERRIAIEAKRCTRCGKCVLICPIAPKALSWKDNGKKEPPRYDFFRCIRCFCCQEICPSKAITANLSFAGTIFAKITHPLSGDMAAPLMGMKKESHH
jgi:uncharacterized protein (DUF362 family)/NAD-dependent dihydropyrimidine dehydrogenase PreA subunit